MKRYIKYNNILLILMGIVIAGMLFACQDDFDSTINKENNNISDGNITDDDEDESIPGPGWKKITEIGTPRGGAGAVLVNDALFIYGGEDDSGVRGDLWKYKLSISTPGSSDKIAYTGLVGINNVLYSFGGKDVNGDPTQNLIYYDIVGNSWGKILGPSGFNNPTPSARYSHISLAYNNTIFVHGGFGDTDGTLYRLIDLEETKPDSIKFDNKFGLKLAEHAGVIINDIIYIFGGVNTGTTTAATLEYKNDLYEYNITSPVPEVKKLIPANSVTARSAMQMVATNSGLYVYGGKNGTGCLNDLWFYSITDKTWTMISTGPARLCHYNALKYVDGANTYLLIYGGYYTDSAGKKIYNCELWQYPIN